jgi:RND family efflux transporter MFP subunit
MNIPSESNAEQPRLFLMSLQWLFLRALPIIFALLVGLLVSSMTLGQTPQASTGSPTMIYEGFTEPMHDIMVAAIEIGRLESVTVQVGDRVRAGQVIGCLEDALQVSSVEIARYQAAMTGELEAARAEAELHRLRTESLRALAVEAMTRPDELSRAETDLQIALARARFAEEQAGLRKLELARYQLQQERRKIRVPMDGIVSEVFHEPGEYITPSDPAVARVLVMDKMYAVFNVPVEDTAHIKIDTPVRILLRSRSTTMDANVSFIAPDIDGESGTVQIRVELDNADGQLLSGDRCTLWVAPEAGQAKAAPSRSALLPDRLPPTTGASQR